MNKFVKIFLIIAIVAGIGFSGWYFFLREPVLKVEFYGASDVVKYLSGDGEYKENDKVVLVAEDKEGYDFAFWLKDGKSVSTEKTYSFVMSEETSGKYTAQYNPREFEIFSPDGNISESTAKTDELVFVNVAVPKGFCVDEIYYVKQNTEERVDINDSQFKMPPSNISIVVTIKEIDYVITYNLQGGSFDGNEIETYTINTPTFVLPTPKLDGYSFIGYTDEENIDPILNYEIKKGTYKDITVTANWELAPLSIKTNIEGEGSLDINSSAFLGDEVSFVVRPEEGYSLEEIYYIVDGSDEKVFIEGESFEMPNKPITIYVVFNKAEYTLTTVTENGLVSLSKQTATAGEEITVTATPNTGYEVVSCFYIAENTLTQVEFTSSFIMPANNVEVFVVFGLANYEINYVLNGGTLPQEYIDSYCLTDFVTLPIPTKVGHIFDGWFESESLTGQKVTSFDGSEVGGKTFYALFKPESIAVKFLNYDGSELLSTSFDYGSTASYTGATPVKPSTERYNYTFSGWSPELTTLTESVEYTAVFTETLRKYMVVFAANGGVEVDSKEYTYEQVLGELPQTTQAGYAFEGWYTSLTNGVKATPETVIKGNTTFIAKWSVVNYTLTYVLDGGSLQNPVNSYNIETPTFTLETPTKTGYNFAGWIVNQGDEPNLNMVIEKGSIGDKTYTAVWQIQTFVVTWKNYDGSVIVTDSDVEYNTIPTYTGETPVKPSSLEYDFEFTGWFPTVTNIISDATYTAVFTSNLRTYTITKGQIENGEISVAESAKVGEEVAVTVTPDDGYLLSSLYYINDSRQKIDIEDSKFNMPTSDITIYADFRYVGPLYEIQLSSGILSIGGISVSQTQAYEGETISLVFADDFVAPPGTELDFKYKELGTSSENYKDFGLSFTMPAYSVFIAVDIMDIFYSVSKAHTINGSFVVSNSATTYNEIITITANPNEGFEVSRMYYKEAGKTAEVEFDITFNMPANDVTVYVEFVKSLHNIMLIEEEYSVEGVTLSHTKAHYGETINITLPEDFAIPTGKKLVVEYMDMYSHTPIATPIEDLSFEMPNYDIVVSVRFDDINYGVYIDPALNGSYECNCVTQIYGCLVKVTVTPDEGYEVLRVYYNKVGDTEQVNIEKSSSTYNFIMPASSVIVYVEFGKITSYTITTVVEGNGSISCPTSCVGGKDFNIITSTTNTDVDYAVVYYVGEVSNEKVILLEIEKTTADFPKINIDMPRENITLYAEFYEPIGYSITNGTFVEGVSRAVPGREVKFIATANFAQYVVESATYIGAYDTSDVISSIKLEDGSYEFSFVMSEKGVARVSFGYAIHSIAKAETTNGSFSCPSTAGYNSVVTVTATPDVGYEVYTMFYCKSTGGGIEVKFDSTFTMPNYDVVIYVAFSKIENVYVITKNVTGNSDVTCVQTAYVGEEVEINIYDQNEAVDYYEVYYVGKTSQTRVDLFDTSISYIEDVSLTFTMPEEDVTLYVICSYTISYKLIGCKCETEVRHAIAGEMITFVTTMDDENYILKNAMYLGASIFANLEIREIEDGKTEFSFVMPRESICVEIEYKAPTFNITKYAPINGSFSCPSTAEYNSTVTVTATPDPGYEIFQMYYCNSNGGGLEFTFDYTFTMPNFDITIYVYFEAIPSYTITQEIEGKGTVSCVDSAKAGDSVVVFATPDEDYGVSLIYYIEETSGEVFCEYPKDSNPLLEFTFIMPEDNITLYIEFSYYINYVCTNCEPFGAYIEYASFGEEIMGAVQPINTNYVFDEVYYIGRKTQTRVDLTINDFSGHNQFGFVMPDETIDLYVKFVEPDKVHSISIYEVHNGTVNCVDSAIEGKLVTVTATPDPGYEVFQMFYYNASGNGLEYSFDSTFTMPNYDIVICVEFCELNIEHTITKAETSNGSFSCPSTADYNSTVTVTATPDSGYEVFQMFYYNANGNGLEYSFDSTFTMPDFDIVIHVEFVKASYNIAVDGVGLGCIDIVNPTSATAGEDVALEITLLPDTEIYDIHYLAKNSKQLAKVNLTYVGEDKTGLTVLEANFEMPAEDIIIYVSSYVSGKTLNTIDVVSVGNGFAHCVQFAYEDAEINLYIEPEEDYEVLRMYYIKAGYTDKNEIDSTFIMPNNNITVYVEFSKRYNIKSTTPDNGEIFCGLTALAGQEVTVSVCEYIDYEISRMYYIEEGKTEEIEFECAFVMPNSNITIYAEFSAIDDESEPPIYIAAVGYFTNDYRLGKAICVKHYPQEQKTQLRAVAKDGAKFVEWRLGFPNGKFVSTEETIIIENGNDYFAIFEEKTKYNITKIKSYGGDVICQDTAYEGEEVTIRLAPTSVTIGYEIHIVGENTNITTTISSTTYTFTMPSEDVSITVNFNNNEPMSLNSASVAGECI